VYRMRAFAVTVICCILVFALGTGAVRGVTVKVDRLSFPSLYVQLLYSDSVVAQATGFVVAHKQKHFLITNWHVLSGRRVDTNEPLFWRDTVAFFPHEVCIFHHGKTPGTWVRRYERLRDAKNHPRWLEHPRGREIDVAALPLESVDDEVRLYPLDLSLANTDMKVYLGMPVSIIGFPFGLTGPRLLPIWKTGHIASDPYVDWKRQPVVLIDATTRGGMSGSPVVVRFFWGYHDTSGFFIMDGAVHTLFFGVYSGRIYPDSELGKVWRPRVITEILEQAGH